MKAMLKKSAHVTIEMLRGDRSLRIQLTGGIHDDLWGNCSGLWGDCSGLKGDCSDLKGDCSGLKGDCSGLRGDIDDCALTEGERKEGVAIESLAKGEKP